MIGLLVPIYQKAKIALEVAAKSPVRTGFYLPCRGMVFDAFLAVGSVAAPNRLEYSLKSYVEAYEGENPSVMKYPRPISK